ncbi:MAG: peptidylprolyl isomerase [bacterium]
MKGLCVLLLLGASLAGCAGTEGPATVRTTCDATRSGLSLGDATDTAVLIKTSMGCMVADLYDAKAPITVANFKAYVGESFYDNTHFYRIVKGFVDQGGGERDRGSGTHTAIKNEAKTSGLHNLRYTFSMARLSAADSATSEFFVNAQDNTAANPTHNLDPGGVSPDGYAVFGVVILGSDVVDAMQKVPLKACPLGDTTCPVTPIVIESIRVLA